MLTKQPESPVKTRSRRHVEKRSPKEKNIEEPTTRKEQKKKQRKEMRQSNKKPRRRMFPIWLRLIVVLLLAAIALIVGLMVGYGVLGDGAARDALKMETWQHIIDIVKKEK